MVITIVYPQDLGNWRWNNEKLEWTHDKEAHFTGSFGLYYLFKYKNLSTTKSVLYTVSLGILKETIDALVPYEKYGSYGGDGWSNADIKANLLGLGTGYLIDKLWENNSYENKSVSIKVNTGFIRVSIYLD